MGIFIAVTVDADRCSSEGGCRECVQRCPVDVFVREGGAIAEVVEANEDECILCDLCVAHCPVEAVAITKRY